MSTIDLAISSVAGLDDQLVSQLLAWLDSQHVTKKPAPAHDFPKRGKAMLGFAMKNRALRTTAEWMKGMQADMCWVIDTIMSTEIERKYLLKSGQWQPTADGRRMTQGYLSRDPDRTVRVRLVGDKAFMTVKSRRTGITRTEIEFPITLQHARDMLELCYQPLIDKTRHEVMYDGMLWEVDVFHGANNGLIVAEIELPAEDTPFTLPEWIGEEVSHDMRYTNSRLSAVPFSEW